jgi:hypothetical protein
MNFQYLNINLNRKEKGKDFLNPSTKRLETTCGPARASTLDLLGSSHSAGHDQHRAAHQAISRPKGRMVGARVERPVLTLDAARVRGQAVRHGRRGRAGN